MALEFEILSPEDKPALLGVGSGDLLTISHSALIELGYKVHIAENHEEFLTRFGQFQYQVVVLEETFGGVAPEDNTALKTLQQMPMNQRRHAVILLLGESFETLNALQAFQQSVHAVINRGDMDKAQLIFQQVVNDATAFLHVYRSTQEKLTQTGR